MRAQLIGLDEAPAVEQNRKPLAREQFTLLMLALSAQLSATSFGALVELAKLVYIVDRRHSEKFSLEEKCRSPGGRVRR